MKILVIGAAGNTDEAVVEKALVASHGITVFVQKTDKYQKRGVRIIEGDATEQHQSDQVVRGQDVWSTRSPERRPTRPLLWNRAPLTRSPARSDRE